MRRLLLLVLPLFLGLEVWSATRATNLDILVRLHPDGSATIIETWDIFVDGNGECYVRMDHMYNMTMHDFRAGIYEEDGTVTEYEYIEPWNPNASRAEKAGYCGINPLSPDTWERNWALGTQDGNHKYIVIYELDNVVRHYSDGEGLHHSFMQLDVPVEKFCLCIKSDDGQPWFQDARAWTFRNDSELSMSKTSVIIQSLSPLLPGDKLLVTIWFPPGTTLAPSFTVEEGGYFNGTFQQLVDEALEGSDYLQRDDSTQSDDSLVWLGLWGMIFAVVWIVLMILAIPLIYKMMDNNALHTAIFLIGAGLLIFPLAYLAWLFSKWRRGSKKRKFKDDLNSWQREIPLDGNLTLAYRVDRYFYGDPLIDDPITGKQFPELLIQAHLLRLINWRCIDVVPNNAAGAKEKYAIKVLKAPTADNAAFSPATKLLYSILDIAADDQRMVTKKSMEKDSWKYANPLKELQQDIATPVKYPPTHDQARQVGGLRRFLIDNTLLNERQLTEARLWDELIVYATLFGVAEKVIEELQAVNPDLAKMYSFGTATATLAVTSDLSKNMSRYLHTAYHSGRATHRSSSSSSYSSGRGGRSSRSGGGSHHTGGGGGGFR